MNNTPIALQQSNISRTSGVGVLSDMEHQVLCHAPVQFGS